MRIRALAEAPDNSPGEVSLDEGGVELAIWRREDGVMCSPLDQPTAVFLKSLAGGSTLAEAIGHLEAEVLAGVFAEFVITGFFAAPDRS
jgi:hypothetical protein